MTTRGRSGDRVSGRSDSPTLPVTPSPDQLSLDWTLDPQETRVLQALQAHRGRARAIQVAHLALFAEVPQRTVQQVVHRLRVEHGQPIASTAARPAGYYIPETAEEVEQFVHEQRAKALGTLAAIAAVRKVALAELLGQLALEVKAA